MKSLNIRHFRLSFSWSRLIPTGKIADGINPKGIVFYKNVIDELLR
jgi:beta-glucosidase/6-phospho-beta-glucosidase/beta-galactosidase